MPEITLMTWPPFRGLQTKQAIKPLSGDNPEGMSGFAYNERCEIRTETAKGLVWVRSAFSNWATEPASEMLETKIHNFCNCYMHTSIIR